MLKLSKQSDYALIILSQLSREKELYSLSDLIQKTKLPRRFLARIAATLTKNGLLRSKEGKDGGYQVTEKIKTLSLYDFLSIFEKHMDFIHCDTKECAFEEICHHKKKIQTKLTEIVVAQLKKVPLKEFIL